MLAALLTRQADINLSFTIFGFVFRFHGRLRAQKLT